MAESQSLWLVKLLADSFTNQPISHRQLKGLIMRLWGVKMPLLSQSLSSLFDARKQIALSFHASHGIRYLVNSIKAFLHSSQDGCLSFPLKVYNPVSDYWSDADVSLKMAEPYQPLMNIPGEQLNIRDTNFGKYSFCVWNTLISRRSSVVCSFRC